MGFRRLIDSKKILSLFAAFTLLGTNTLMAQTAAAGTDAPVDKGAMWLGVGYYVLLFLLVCVIVAVVGKILKIYDLTLKMQGKKGIQWNNIIGVFCIVFLVAGLYGAYWSFTEQGTQILPESASAHGGKIDMMFWVTTAITMVVFLITQVLLFGFAFKYRGSDKRKGYYYPHNNTIEKIWTIIPAIVLTILVVFGFFTWREVTNTKEVKGDINIEITGHQFAWELRYPGKDGKLGSSDYQLYYTATNMLAVSPKDRNSYDDLKADTLVLPVNKSIRLNIHAQDVIHSVYLPHFRVQMNAVPGLPTFFKFTPTITTADMRNRLDDPNFNYLLYCNKICGGGHYNMQKVVMVVTEAEYQEWLAHQKPYVNDQLKKEWQLAYGSQVKELTGKRVALNN
ncbi:cytochrome c oxidase subunit II [Mucilaginibacter ginsenosidivorans]|uniref:Cytochrome c oxidase subunit 2 n=1 Tax=Mucilaginibacter ginsenosidivorans TaxID=398053 RepID=A0A5B8V3Z2_9SPHI|nr:cytochrome c oxidase subunit II [Mucilaginibacter ginsenosidivorans]QEC65533.1 cytochrome c oxidase subunit II [Mucilaginibacter ginsenosidivorans]